MPPSTRSSRDSKGRKVKLSRGGDPEKRPFLTRIYGLVGCLIVSLALIVLLVILQKKLPDGSNSTFHIPVRRDLEEPAQKGKLAVREVDVLKVEQRTIQVAPRIIVPTFISDPIFHFSLDCVSTGVDCTTSWIPHKLGKRQSITCTSTYVTTPCTTSTSTTPPPFIGIITPIRFSLFPITPTPTPTCVSGMEIEVGCTTEPITIYKKGKRQGGGYNTFCDTTTFGPCPTPPPVSVSSNSCMATTTSCTTFDYEYSAPVSCTSWSSPIFGCGWTPIPPTCISSTSLAIACTTEAIVITKPKNKREEIKRKRQGDGSSTICSTSTIGPCSSSTSSSSRTTTPPVSVSSNSCVATSTSCTTINRIDSYDTICSPVYSTISGCGVTTSSSSTSSRSVSTTYPPVSVSSNSCISTAVSCTTISEEPWCVTSYGTIPGCGITSSSRSSSSSVVSPTSSPSSYSSSSSLSVSVTPPSTSSSSSSLPKISSSSSSRTAVVSPISITTSSSSSSTPTISPTTGPSGPSTSSISSLSSVSFSGTSSSSTPFSSSTGPTAVVLPVSTNSTSSLSSSSVSLGPVPSISSSLPVPISGSSTAPTTGPPVLVVITPSGSSSLVSGKPSSTTSTPSGSVSAGPVLIGLPSSSSGLPAPASSLPFGSTFSGSPANLPSASGSSSLPAPGLLKLPSGSTVSGVSGVSVSISSIGSIYPSGHVSPSTLSKVPTSSTIPSASVPSGSVTTPLSVSPSASWMSSASSGLLQSDVSPTPSLLPTTAGGDGGGGGSPSPSDNPKPINAQPDIWPLTQTILGDYTPLIISRGFLMLLGAMWHQLEQYEPIRQLLLPGGGSLVDFPAAIPIQFAIFCAHLGTGFSAGATFFDTGYCNPAQTNDPKVCPPKLSVNKWVVDVIIVTLVVQVLTIIYVISQWWTKPGGFSADPTSIAGIAAFMGHPEIEQEFLLLPTEINYAGLKRRMRGRKFRLGQFVTERGNIKYGIMPADDENEPTKKDGFFTKLGNWWSAVQTKSTFLQHWKKNRFLSDGLFVALLLALLGLTIDAVSRINKTEVVFLATAAASGTGWRIFIAILGVIVSYYWGRLFRDAQTFAPYIDLARGSSNADATILLKRHSIPLTAFFPLLWYCHYTPASIAFIGLIAELLIVALSGLPYRPGQQRGEFLFWGITSLTILTLMIFQLVGISFWRRKLPHLPRAPDSIASVMTYVAGTSMARDFNGLEQMKRKERDQAIKDLEKSYAYWWRREEDGRIRWVVDEMPGGKNRALMDGASEYS